VAVIRKNAGKTEVLLGLRLNNPGKGKWSFPGGGADGKEKLLTAGIREFWEEVGVRLYSGYITKIGVYKIRNPLFDWETQIIETTQDINPKGIRARSKTSETVRTYGGEFSALEWVALEDLGQLRLHRWVREAVKVYQSNQMKPYIPKSPAKVKVKRPVGPSPAYKALRDEFDFFDRPGSFRFSSEHPNMRNRPKRAPGGADMLFDIAEMVLTKTDPDGTGYYMPKYAPAVTKGRTATWK
jgi:8-oxo-dGTP pyrophosphatase MutT (NUDIX family)